MGTPVTMAVLEDLATLLLDPSPAGVQVAERPALPLALEEPFDPEKHAAVRCEFVDGKSRKFWEAQREGTTVVLRWGALGASGQSKTMTFATVPEANQCMEDRLAEKTKKGYVLVAAEPGPDPRA